MNQSCDLNQKHCVPCEGGVPPLTVKEYQPLLKEVKGWEVKDKRLLEKETVFKNFKEALRFINQVGAIAEAEGHHPDILLHGWNKVKFTLSTHAIHGLSENDFILASKIDEISDK